VTKDTYKPSNFQNDPSNIINQDKRRKAAAANQSEEHNHVHQDAGSFLFLAFKSQEGCSLSVGIKICGTYTHSFLSGDHNNSDVKIQFVS
jgi:hypothetical protein